MASSKNQAPELSRRGFVAGSCLLAAGVPSVATAATQEQTALADTVETRVTESLEEYDIPGATVAVVEDGAVTLTAGYGVTERGTGQSVEATTPFRVGSVSKPVVWTAIAQRVVDGDLATDRPISASLDAELHWWDEPVTLADLATHTGGFETTNLGMWYPSPNAVDPLPAHLSRSKPSQVRSPGTRGAYSNHGVALAGQVFAEAVGESFADAMDRVLFEPAGMNQSSFQQPLPDEIRTGHAVGHDDDLIDSDFAGIGMAPAGALSTTAEDMARFMQLHLTGGVLDGQQVLDSETITLSHQQWFTHHEKLAGMTFGFTERIRGGVRALTHDGATPLFQSTLFVIPQQDIGVFIAFNSANAVEPRRKLRKELLDELLPESELPDQTAQPTAVEELTGTYQTLRKGETTHDALPVALNATDISVSAVDGGIRLDRFDGRWIEIEPLVFEHEESGRKLAFERVGGEIAYLYLGGVPSAFRRKEWYESVGIHLLVAFVAFIGLAIGARQFSPTRHREQSRREWLATAPRDPRRLAELTGYGGSLVFLAFYALTIGYLVFAPLGFLSDPSMLYRLAFVLPIGGALASPVAAVTTVWLCVGGHWHRRRRLLYGVVAVSLVVTAAFFWYWNLLFPP